jgi:hypothetical protein
MSIAKRTAGLILFVLGCVGLAASIAGMAGTWVFRARLDAVTVEVHKRVDSALGEIRGVLGTSEKRLAATRQDVATMKTEGVLADLMKGSDRIRPLVDRLERAIDWLAVLESASEVTEHLLAAVDSASQLQGEFERPRDLIEPIRAGRQHLVDAVAEVEKFQEQIADARNTSDRVTLRELVEKLCDGLDEKLAAAQGCVQRFEQGLGDTQIRLTGLRDATLGWWFKGALVVTLLGLWIGVSQWSLARLGWGIVVRRVKSEE